MMLLLSSQFPSESGSGLIIWLWRMQAIRSRMSILDEPVSLSRFCSDAGGWGSPQTSSSPPTSPPYLTWTKLAGSQIHSPRHSPVCFFCLRTITITFDILLEVMNLCVCFTKPLLVHLFCSFDFMSFFSSHLYSASPCFLRFVCFICVCLFACCKFVCL